jgi:hypothetical protein
MMNYLQPSDYELYGLEAATAPAWVIAASAIVDAHCRRVTLSVTQYTERLLLTTGRNTVRLTYLPLAAVAPATSRSHPPAQDMRRLGAESGYTKKWLGRRRQHSGFRGAGRN